ncbi:cingulin-like [Anthonomus grandis grandis]|uniref:cingulin-like n=1 Tax=Anthonomus grandis grandis TaxID=2921223 RepID=UPI0021668498|nr:cingulin-like [Anthonomus grandis grandis]
MTSSRVIRGTKAKIFLYVCAVIAITGLIACYNSTLSQLDEVRKSNELCREQQENLSTQLQVISDYKQKLEKSLKNEKAEHQQSRSNLEIKINEERSKSQKLTNDALIKYSSLQQHYKLLETQHDDFKEEASKTQKQQLEEINSLQAKLKEVEEELKKVKASKESIKTQLTELELENTQINKALQRLSNNDSQNTLNLYADEYRILAEKYNVLKTKCGIPEDEIVASKAADLPNKPSEKSNPLLPELKLAENPSSSTKTVLKSVGGAALNGAIAPSPTPESVKKEANLKPPQGVVAPMEVQNSEDQNEQPQVLPQPKHVDRAEDPEKDNVAQEEFDGPIAGMDYAEDSIKHAVNLEHKENRADNKNQHEEQQYKDLQQEEGGDDDADYPDRPPRPEEVVIRN